MEAIEEVTLLGYREPDSVLVMRNDRLGDLVLALPLIRALRKAFPTAKLGVLASAYAAPLLERDGDIDRVHAQGKATLKELRAEGYARALVLWPTRKNAWLAWRAGIGERYGANGRLHSWLFNRRLALRRSQGWRSEAEYNLDFLRAMSAPAPYLAPRLALDPAETKQAAGWVKKHAPAGRGPVVMLHPGSGGSAQNWDAGRYAALGDALAARDKARVLVTGSPAELPLMERVAAGMKAKAKAKVMRQALPLRQFAAVCGQANLFVSASTGPMHLAAACGAPTLSLFPPIRAMSPLRWGPLGNRHAVLTPAGLGFGLKSRRDGEGRVFNFANLVGVDQALAASRFLLVR